MQNRTCLTPVARTWWVSGAVIASLVCAGALPAQIRVNPTGVSTNAMNATTVFLSFGGLRNQTPVEGIWCGELIAATPPARGLMCDPSTVFGRLPERSNLSRTGANGAFTDIMSIPATVARRAYLSAAGGRSGTFFYVRRFASLTGGADEFVTVTCRLTGGGAGVPFSLTNVDLSFETTSPVQFVRAGEIPPPVNAVISYNGSGQLRGRWEVVMPGEELPSANDLLTESTLPAEERGTQRRYALLERFNIVVNPGGRIVLPGPQPSRLPHQVEGTYLLLLRIESTDDKAGDADLTATGAGNRVLHNGAVAGFPMPVLRYVVGVTPADAPNAGGARVGVTPTGGAFALQLIAPANDATLSRDSLVRVQWQPVGGAAFYRVEFERIDGAALLSALVRAPATRYDVPPMVRETAGNADVRWRVVAVGARGSVVRRSVWFRYRVVPR